jgi:hypothetical protein
MVRRLIAMQLLSPTLASAFHLIRPKVKSPHLIDLVPDLGIRTSPLGTHACNHLQHSFLLFIDQAIWNPQDVYSLLAKVVVALAVVLFPFEMRIAVQLDHQTCDCAIEVQDVGAKWVLATKSISGEAAMANNLPQDPFGGCGTLPH